MNTQLNPADAVREALERLKRNARNQLNAESDIYAVVTHIGAITAERDTLENHLADAMAAVAEQDHEAEVNAKNAARYRWLRDSRNAHVSIMPRGTWFPDPTHLDAAIDAAMQEPQP